MECSEGRKHSERMYCTWYRGLPISGGVIGLVSEHGRATIHALVYLSVD